MRYLAWLLFLLCLAGCFPRKTNPDGYDTGTAPHETGEDSGATTRETGETGDTATVPRVDDDGDGFTVAEGDCDDANPAINPTASEVCDSQDNNCDGQTDEGVTNTLYQDVDEDGYGSSTELITCLSTLLGWVPVSGDCDDLDFDINPGAAEVCDEADNDCDGEVDEDVELTFYADVDGDGFGDPDLVQKACVQPTGYVADNTDCADNDSRIFPGGSETCDSLDNDCDGTTDEDPMDGATWFLDADGDGVGGSSASLVSCLQPAGYGADATDCDDTNSAVYPGAPEYCNVSDDDCDGTVDEDDSLDAGVWYKDNDGDGFGDLDVIEVQCVPDADYVADNTDCDDTDAAINPSAAEECDGLDNDCDGSVDEDGAGAVTWYADADGDGYGDPAVTAEACDAPANYTADATDCDDSDAAMNPGAPEVCDAADNNCDGWPDEPGAVDETAWYVDVDGDGYGDATSLATLRCDGRTMGEVSDNTDCDDTDAAINPSAAEECDSLDNNCSGSVDEDPSDGDIWYVDADSDGYGDLAGPQLACSQPSGYVEDDSDCDDTDPTWYWACSDCERELVSTIGFSQDWIWPGDSSDVLATFSLDSGTAATDVGIRWTDSYGDNWVACGQVLSAGPSMVMSVYLQEQSSYLAFGWYNAGTLTYVPSTDFTGAMVNGLAYSNNGDIGGNAAMSP